MLRVDELHAQVRRIYTSCLKDTLFQSSKEIPDDIDRDNVAHTTMKKFHLNYFWHRGIKARRSLRGIRSQVNRAVRSGIEQT
jgi:hypothetical protein